MAVIYNEDNFEKAMHLADKLREDYDTSLFLQPKKIGKLYAKLEADGFVGADDARLGRGQALRRSDLNKLNKKVQSALASDALFTLCSLKVK